MRFACHTPLSIFFSRDHRLLPLPLLPLPRFRGERDDFWLRRTGHALYTIYTITPPAFNNTISFFRPSGSRLSRRTSYCSCCCSKGSRCRAPVRAYDTIWRRSGTSSSTQRCARVRYLRWHSIKTATRFRSRTPSDSRYWLSARLFNSFIARTRLS